jgi:hypothetical protein
VIILVSYDTDPKKADKYVKDKGWKFDVMACSGLAGDDPSAIEVGVPSLPYQYLIDEKGRAVDEAEHLQCVVLMGE